jgi:hypothetical protein
VREKSVKKTVTASLEKQEKLRKSMINQFPDFSLFNFWRDFAIWPKIISLKIIVNIGSYGAFHWRSPQIHHWRIGIFSHLTLTAAPLSK